MKQKEIDDLSFLLSSTRRYKIVHELKNGISTPTMLSKKLNFEMSVISSLLKELQIRQLIECLNPNTKKGKLFKITSYGERIFKIVK
jgi:ArsR family transcriptional regulator, cadmium/lead-responsive transcriptional repressor